MGDKTKIEWTEATWNPIRGCSRVSEGCRNCYAESVANRFKGEGQPYEGLIAKAGQWNGKITVVEHLLEQPLKWKKPRRIFVNSMSDLFHENVSDDVIDQIFAVMALCPQHTFQILTKRARRMHDYKNSENLILRNGVTIGPRNSENLWPNVWHGVSAEDQKTYGDRVWWLASTPASVRWVSVEPMLSMINTTFTPAGLEKKTDLHPTIIFDSLTGHVQGPDEYLHRIDWVVCGGESGKEARPLNPAWVRLLRDQCQAAGVPFFFKQWGEYWPVKMNDEFGNITHERMERVGKKMAGRLLDGVEWSQYPLYCRTIDLKETGAEG